MRRYTGACDAAQLPKSRLRRSGVAAAGDSDGTDGSGNPNEDMARMLGQWDGSEAGTDTFNALHQKSHPGVLVVSAFAHAKEVRHDGAWTLPALVSSLRLNVCAPFSRTALPPSCRLPLALPPDAHPFPPPLPRAVRQRLCDDAGNPAVPAVEWTTAPQKKVPPPVLPPAPWPLTLDSNPFPPFPGANQEEDPRKRKSPWALVRAKLHIILEQHTQWVDLDVGVGKWKEEAPEGSAAYFLELATPPPQLQALPPQHMPVPAPPPPIGYLAGHRPLFLLDCSEAMLSHNRMDIMKQAMESLLVPEGQVRRRAPWHLFVTPAHRSIRPSLSNSLLRGRGAACAAAGCRSGCRHAVPLIHASVYGRMYGTCTGRWTNTRARTP